MIVGNHDPYSDNTLDCEARPDLMASFTAERHRIQAPIGNCRIRLPLAAKIALQIAGAIGGVPGSPIPPGGSPLGTI